MGLEFDGVNGIIKNTTSDGDVTIKGNDGGSEISLLTFDVSAEGVATFNKDIKIGDSGKAIFGAGSDLQIYHDGTNSYISDQGTNDLKILATDFQLKNAADNEFMMTGTTNGSVTLYYNNVIQFLTSSSGINLPVDGESIKFGANSEIVLSHVHDSGLKITHDGGGDPDLILANTASASDGNQLGQIFWNGLNSNGDEHTYAFILGQVRDVTDGEEDGQLLIYANKGGTSKQFLTIGANSNAASPDHEVCINEESQNIDFRVESNGKTHALFVDGGNDRVGFITAPDLGHVHIRTADSGASAHVSADELVIEGSANSGINILSGNSSEGGIYFGDDGDNDIGRIRYDHTNNSLDFFTNASERMSIDYTGAVTIPNQPAFSVKPSSNQTNIGNNDTIAFGTEIFDQNADFASNTFTAPVTGRYQFNFMVRFDDIPENLGYAMVDIVSSNREYFTWLSPGTHDEAIGFYSFAGSFLVDMDANDTAKLTYQEGDGGTTGQADVSANNSYFSGFLAC